MLKIDSIEISGIGPIRELKVDFNSHFNIICGQNGVGKTTLLECIGQSFAQYRNRELKRNATFEIGKYKLNFNDNSIFELNYSSFRPNEQPNDHKGLYKNGKQIISFKAHRNLNYQIIQNVPRDLDKKDYQFANETIEGVKSNEVKGWLVNRFLWSGHQNLLKPVQIQNFEKAKASFSALNKTVEFSKVDPATNDIMVNTPQGEIYFEYLSSGYKSCLVILLGLIKEIEFRFKDPAIVVSDFEGIVLIDELDVHLHPEWQAKFYKAIKELLPKAQIFTTTHSPHIIQVAEPNEIIPLVFDEAGNVQLKKLEYGDYGFKGWTIEEILKDVMGLQDTRSADYLHVIRAFEAALDAEDYEKADKLHEQLDKMLHPENPLRKILDIQLTGIAQ